MLAPVVYKNGRVAGLVAPGKRQLYWRGSVDVRVDKFDFLWRRRTSSSAARKQQRLVHC